MEGRKKGAKHKEGKFSCKTKQRCTKAKMHESKEVIGDKEGVRSSEKDYT